MTKLYVGPIWGQVKNLKQAHSLNSNNELVFFGGYSFFDNSNKQIIEELLELSQSHKLIFNQSRFEEAFLILAGQLPEKNYHFKRWLNPFSGIFAQLELYSADFETVVNNIEDVGEEIWHKVQQKGHERFYQKLQPDIVSLKISEEIEKSISDKSSFRQLNIYDEEARIIETLPINPAVVQDHIKNILACIKTYELQA